MAEKQSAARQSKLDLIDEQLASGKLIIRPMTNEERKQWGLEAIEGPPGVQVGQLWGSKRKGYEERVVEVIELHTGRSPLSHDGNYRVRVRDASGREGVMKIKTLCKDYRYLRHARSNP